VRLKKIDVSRKQRSGTEGGGGRRYIGEGETMEKPLKSFIGNRCNTLLRLTTVGGVKIGTGLGKLASSRQRGSNPPSVKKSDGPQIARAVDSKKEKGNGCAWERKRRGREDERKERGFLYSLESFPIRASRRAREPGEGKGKTQRSRSCVIRKEEREEIFTGKEKRGILRGPEANLIELKLG